MKNLILSLIGTVLISTSFAQKNFKWDVIVDSLHDGQSELYLKTKLFIAESWKSANDVIQLDDKENSIILVKGISSETILYNMVINYTWGYSYTIKFMFKNGKARLIIDNVICSSIPITTQGSFPYMPVADEYPNSGGLRTTGLNKKKYAEIMTSLKGSLQSIVNLYKVELKKSITIDSNDNW